MSVSVPIQYILNRLKKTVEKAHTKSPLSSLPDPPRTYKVSAEEEEEEGPEKLLLGRSGDGGGSWRRRRRKTLRLTLLLSTTLLRLMRDSPTAGYVPLKGLLCKLLSTEKTLLPDSSKKVCCPFGDAQSRAAGRFSPENTCPPPPPPPPSLPCPLCPAESRETTTEERGGREEAVSARPLALCLT